MVNIATATSEVPKISAVIRVAIRNGFDGATRVPVVRVARSAITKASTGARYHCGVTAVARLVKDKRVTRIAYCAEKIIRTPLMSWKYPDNLSMARENVERIARNGSTTPPIGK
jgi:hypothetical protein